MLSPRVCVLRAPGTNCDQETAHAFEICGGQPEVLHLNRILENPKLLADFQILCIPGGFSYGDDIGSGVIFASQLRTALGSEIGEFLSSDKLVLGICNGFQTLLKAGILPDGADGWARTTEHLAPSDATLTWNANGRYTARWVRLKATSSNSVFLKGIDELDLPIAHAEGRIVVRDPGVLARWESRQQFALTYQPWRKYHNADSISAMTSAQVGGTVVAAPIMSQANPNGSVADLAGLCDPSGRVLGLMPHPERFLFATQHPNWTRLNLKGDGAGKQIFQNAVDYFQ